MTDDTNGKRQAANGEHYAGVCDECGKRTRDTDKVGRSHNSIFCDDGEFESF